MEKLLRSLGNVTAIIGSQWGDEGKGKVIDLLARHYDIVARAVGGANAGHTIYAEGKKFVFHLLPSGLLHEQTVNVIGPGTVVHVPSLLAEIESLRKEGIALDGRLLLSHQAHVLLDAHKEADAVLEERRGNAKIGTTKRGIGPAMATKALRVNLRIVDLLDPVMLKEALENELRLLESLFGIAVNLNKEFDQIREGSEALKPFIKDTVSFLHEQLAAGKSVLIEGAQASQLDLDHGTYPYVTSSATTTAGALHALGLPPQILSSVIGVVKAYTTRVGEGPFPTEMEPHDAERIRERGGEYGSTTGRPRRCGWLDLHALKRVAVINGFTHLNLTKLDVLDQENEIPVAVGSEIGRPVYDQLPGWEQSISGITDLEDVPETAKDYIAFIERHLGLPVSLVGTGQERSAMVVRS